MKTFLLVLGSLVALGLAGYWALTVLGSIDGVELSGHGLAAAGLGLFFTVVVGFGLMALIFFSNKHGHDEDVHSLYSEKQDKDDNS
ncbi:MAG: hypothetical protein HWE25_10875 [Alphaproteobacteria bacterium]|nr:hypothetical protein [Alphaproteobacteria bacterium]